MGKYGFAILALLLAAACGSSRHETVVVPAQSGAPPHACLYQGQTYSDGSRIEPADAPGTSMHCVNGSWESHRVP